MQIAFDAYHLYIDKPLVKTITTNFSQITNKGNSLLMAAKHEDIRDKIENGIYKLATNDKSTRSTVWRVYRKIEKEDGKILEHVLYCIGCKNLMSFTHKSTTNLRRHKCHLQYLKKQAYCNGYADANISKEWFKDDEAEMSVEDILLEAEAELKVDNEESSGAQSMIDELDKKPTSTDVAAFIALRGAGAGAEPSDAGVNTGVPVQQAKSDDDPLNVGITSIPNANSRLSEVFVSHDVSGAEESAIYAQTWSLEYRKLTEDQKFYAKRAIDEIFVLGRLRRLTLNTVPSVTE
ncbi:uncharacterized protein LOC115769330 [Drosophila novamexicana]|uniref:uncharacterized protein LOC115769330 n=1 Tax=Drosophila novamexicana TaxID=47314 RepID=UPI0011E589BA|nr:uncharacterized protein LOC115769330 [Drosophila novamexicana]